jgi:hypothetical protein
MKGLTLEGDEIVPYIKAANLMVTNIFSGDTVTSEELKEEIEKWLAAHMVSSTVWKTAKREKLGEAEVEYTGKFGEDLSSTPYGQMVKVLDTTGKMNNLGKREVVMYSITSFE